MRKYRIRLALLLSLLFGQLALNAQGSFKTLVYQSYIHSDVPGWEKTLNDSHFTAAGPSEKYERAMALYGFIGICIDNDQKKRAKPQMEELNELADQLLVMKPDDPVFLALRGAAYGLQMIYQMHKMMALGPKTVKTLKLATELGPQTPQVLVENGNQAWAMPGIFGGDKELATQQYELAISLMEKNPEYLKENWYYLKLQMVLADWFEQINRGNRSRGIYLKVLQLEPDFELAKERLAAL